MSDETRVQMSHIAQTLTSLQTYVETHMATKEDLKQFATKDELKEELKRFATKEDLNGVKNELMGEVNGLKGEVGELKSEVNGMRGELNGLKGEVGGLKKEIEDVVEIVTFIKDNAVTRHEFFQEIASLRAEIKELQAWKELVRILHRKKVISEQDVVLLYGLETA